MEDEEISKELELRDLYYDPAGGFQSIEKLYRKARKGLSVTRKQVKEWLETQNLYTRFKPLRRKHKFVQTYVKYLGEEIQLDLVDMKKYKDKNEGYIWILTGVEILSRYGFALPVYRKDTKNMKPAVISLLEKFKDHFGDYPKLVQFDEGKEFYNVGVRQVLTDNNIKFFSSHSKKKAAIVERFNRTLKSIMWKYFYSANTHKWLGVLQDFVTNYNSTNTGTTLMKPKDVNKDNENIVWTTLFGHAVGDLPLPKFQIRDTVRIENIKTIFTKGYEANFTEEKYIITKIHRGNPNTYELKEDGGTYGTDNEHILGKFYEDELSLVGKPKDTPPIEKVLKRRKGMVLVKWKGFGDENNSWIPERDLGDKFKFDDDLKVQYKDIIQQERKEKTAKHEQKAKAVERETVRKSLGRETYREMAERLAEEEKEKRGGEQWIPKRRPKPREIK